MKSLLIALWGYLFREWIMFIPFYSIRRFFLKKTVSKLGDRSFIALGAEIRNGKNVRIGKNSVVNKKVLLDGRGGKLTIGNNVDIAQEVNIWTLSHDPQDDYHADKGGDVTVEDYAWIASRATIMPGVRIGKGAVVGAGSVVTNDIPPMTLVAGVPARKIGERTSGLKYQLNYQPWFR